MSDRRQPSSAEDVLHLAQVRADAARARRRTERFPVDDPRWAGFAALVAVGGIPGVRRGLLAADHDDDWRVVWESYRAGTEHRRKT